MRYYCGNIYCIETTVEYALFNHLHCYCCIIESTHTTQDLFDHTRSLLRRSDTRRRHFQRDFTALGKENIDGFLGILLKGSLHFLNFLVGIRLQLGRGIAFRAAFGEGHVVEFLLLFGAVSTDQPLRFDFGLLHTIAAACLRGREKWGNDCEEAFECTKMYTSDRWI
jgi:hypothetical protein